MPKCPKISIPSGADVAVVRITGDVRNQEPDEVRIVFPGGYISVVRATDGPNAEYWAHVGVNRASDGEVVTGDAEQGKLVDGRVDVAGRHTHHCNPGDLRHPDLQHVAVRVARVPR